MIKIEKCLMLGGELGLPNDDWYYLYRGLDIKANIYAEVIARKEDIDKSKKFEKQVKDRVKFVIKNKIGLKEKNNTLTKRTKNERNRLNNRQMARRNFP